MHLMCCSDAYLHSLEALSSCPGFGGGMLLRQHYWYWAGACGRSREGARDLGVGSECGEEAALLRCERHGICSQLSQLSEWGHCQRLALQPRELSSQTPGHGLAILPTGSSRVTREAALVVASCSLHGVCVWVH